MKIAFPYPGIEKLTIPDKNLMGVFGLPEIRAPEPAGKLIERALARPIGSPRLKDALDSGKKVLIVSDDNTRPTPVKEIMPFLLGELNAAGVKDENVRIIMALGTHRPMTAAEMEAKLGKEVTTRFAVINHDSGGGLFFYGTTSLGVDIWINKAVRKADYIIGLGRIMPLMAAGFTGGGKIIVPGICGDKTNDQMHWRSLGIPEAGILGRRDNPVRKLIDEVAVKTGLKFIVNVIMNAAGGIVGVVAGDPVRAHREGCRRARAAHTVKLPGKADVVIADGYPFDIEFWQVNKALDAAGMVVRKGGIVIIISPCCEGVSRTHPEILRYGYQETGKIRKLVEEGKISPTVGVHMIQVSRVAVERAKCILVSEGISQEEKKKLGLIHAATPQQALEKAFAVMGKSCRVAVLRNAAEMVPVVEGRG